MKFTKQIFLIALCLFPLLTSCGKQEIRQDSDYVPVTENVTKDYTYIANQKTKKFHIPSCESVYQMNDENRVYLNGTRDDAIEKGYSPCKRCNP